MDPVRKAHLMVQAAEELGLAAAKMYEAGILDGCIAANTILDMVLWDLAEHNELNFPIVTRGR